MSERLSVVLYGAVMGHVERISRYSEPTFHYDPAYVATGSVPMSVRLPLGSAVYRGKAVAPFLDGLLPENRATRQRWAERLGTDGDDSFSLLARMGWDCPGAIQFCPPEQLDDMRSRVAETHPTSEAEIGDRLRRLRDDSASWALPEEHWSLPGQQDKFTLTRRDDAWHEARGATPTTHIIKPGIGRLHHQALVEHATMRAAASLGVDIADTEFRRFDGEAAIVVERFDRVRASDGTVLRLHQEDFCQAVGRLPDRKYEADQGPTLKDMATIVDRHCTDLASARRALADFLIINYVAGAPDGHSKNISLALLPNGTRIAPLYDLASGFPYDGNAQYRKVALAVGGRRQFGQVLAQHWDRAAETLSLPADQVRERVLGLAAGFPDALATALDSIDATEARQVRDRSVDRVAAHCADLAARLTASTRTTNPAGPRPHLPATADRSHPSSAQRPTLSSVTAPCPTESPRPTSTSPSSPPGPPGGCSCSGA